MGITQTEMVSLFCLKIILITVIRDDQGKYIIIDIEILGNRMHLFYNKTDKIVNNYILIGGD